MKQTLQTLLTYGRETLKRRGNPEPELDAKYLLLEAFHTDMVHFLMNRSVELPDNETIAAQIAVYREMIERRARRTPLQQILGTQEFMGLTFLVNRHVLIPRQDTETLVEWVLAENQSSGTRILDMCTGSGCIALSLAVLGKYQSLAAVDLSARALAVARKNAARHLGADYQQIIRFFQGDLFGAFQGADEAQAFGAFDVLVSNPPYIPSLVIEGLEPEVKDFEPRMALDGSGDGLHFYRRLAAECGTYLKPGGRVYLEIGYDQGEAVSALFEAAGFTGIEVRKDAAGNDRAVKGEKQC